MIEKLDLKKYEFDFGGLTIPYDSSKPHTTITVYSNELKSLEDVRQLKYNMIQILHDYPKIKLNYDNLAETHDRNVPRLIKAEQDNEKLKAEIEELKKRAMCQDSWSEHLELKQLKQRLDEEFAWWVNHGMEGQYSKMSILSLLTYLKEGKK